MEAGRHEQQRDSGEAECPWNPGPGGLQEEPWHPLPERLPEEPVFQMESGGGGKDPVKPTVQGAGSAGEKGAHQPQDQKDGGKA